MIEQAVSEWNDERESQVGQRYPTPFQEHEWEGMTAAGADALGTGQKVADELRTTILGLKDGDYLGAEADLLKQLNVSRPTFRQAARILESEQLLRIKRGPKGGYFVRKPSSIVVAQAAANYLASEGVSLDELNSVLKTLLRDNTIAAATGTNHAARHKLIAIRNRLNADPSGNDLAAFARDHIDLVFSISELAGNRLATLIIRALFRLGLPETVFELFEVDGDRRRMWSEVRSAYAGAVLDGDAELALQLNRDSYDLAEQWRESGGGDRPTP